MRYVTPTYQTITRTAFEVVITLTATILGLGGIGIIILGKFGDPQSWAAGIAVIVAIIVWITIRWRTGSLSLYDSLNGLKYGIMVGFWPVIIILTFSPLGTVTPFMDSLSLANLTAMVFLIMVYLGWLPLLLTLALYFKEKFRWTPERFMLMLTATILVLCVLAYAFLTSTWYKENSIEGDFSAAVVVAITDSPWLTFIVEFILGGSILTYSLRELGRLYTRSGNVLKPRRMIGIGICLCLALLLTSFSTMAVPVSRPAYHELCFQQWYGFPLPARSTDTQYVFSEGDGTVFVECAPTVKRPVRMEALLINWLIYFTLLIAIWKRLLPKVRFKQQNHNQKTIGLTEQ